VTFIFTAAHSVNTEIRTATDITLKVSSDKYSSEDDITEYEILIGNTNRPETAEALADLGENDWICAVYGGKIVMVGCTDCYTIRAVNYFLDMYVKGMESARLDANLCYTPKEDVTEFLWADANEINIQTSSLSPRVYTLKNGTVLAAYETSSGIKCARSLDGGLTFVTSNEALASFYPKLACANPNIFQLENGDILLAYRAIGSTADGFYTSLQVSISTNGSRSSS